MSRLLIRTSSDPFLKHVARPFHATLNVLGVPVSFSANQRWLLKLAQEAFEGLPAIASHESHSSLQIDLLANNDLAADAFAEPPLYQQYANAELFSAIFSPADAVLCALNAHHALITVSPAMHRFAYNVRYEMIENAAFHLVGHYLQVVPLHGAGLAYNGQGVLILGESGAGKSTLTTACLSAGWGLLGEDSVFVLPQTPLRGRGVPNFVHLLEDAQRFFPAAYFRGPRIVRRSGRSKFVLDVRKCFPAAPHADAPLHTVVFLQPFQIGRAKPMLRALTAKQAERRLTATQPFGAAHARWPQVLAELLRLPAYALFPNADVHQSVQILSDLMLACGQKN